jgi:hypothetical protein
MKKFIIASITVLMSSFGFSQTAQQLNDMGLNNGCNSYRTSNGNEYTYLSIMQSSAQTREYKEAFDLGWRRCQSSSDWKIINGKLVNTYKPPINKTPKPGVTWYDLTIIFTGGKE